MLSLVRICTSRVKEENVTRCVSEGVDALPAKPKHSALVRTNRVVSALTDTDLKLLCSDKEGGFAVLPSALYHQKAREDVLNNFKAAPDVKPHKVKKGALRLCEELALTKLASSVKKSPELSLKIFFFFLPRRTRHEALSERSSLNAALGSMSLGSFCKGRFHY
ncbi:hypothetical protein HPB48_020484 [Haemaphysalis longicornis]|uniref:Uncharacterized protein n=1 Tax=Haemaphysalis longicornis TaxID=44386 RepID=A0A9J6FCW5_HAELO|nr:hypothetical protein HPB48_020484 [Haemaphysalis longicornis]